MSRSLLAGSLLAFGACPASALAHGFGQRVDLSLPLWLWLLGAALTVLLSFAAVIDFLPARLQSLEYPRWTVLRDGSVARVLRVFLLWPSRVIAVGLLGLTLYAGFFGVAAAEANLAPSLIWSVFWIGAAFAACLLGDVWNLLNPLRTIFQGLEWVVKKTLRRPLRPLCAYPTVLGVWPAVLALLAFAYAEHQWAGATQPAALAFAVAIYVSFTLLAMFVFGRETWLHNGDAFSMVFNLFARFAPFELRVERPAARGACDHIACTQSTNHCINGAACWRGSPALAWQINLRPPAAGLLLPLRGGVGVVIFVLVVIAGVSFDGLVETSFWQEINGKTIAAAANDVPRAELAPWRGSLALIALPLIFFGGFLACCRLAAHFSPALIDKNSERSASLQIASAFILSLMPIAIAYHLAHYLGALIDAPRKLGPLLADPLGRTWNGLDPPGISTLPEIVSGDTLWNVVVAAIVIGHVLSVYVAYVIALDRSGAPSAATRGVAPMLIALIGYTLLSLWILAQPLFA